MQARSPIDDIPPPEKIAERIRDMTAELKTLRKLLRVSVERSRQRTTPAEILDDAESISAGRVAFALPAEMTKKGGRRVPR